MLLSISPVCKKYLIFYFSYVICNKTDEEIQHQSYFQQPLNIRENSIHSEVTEAYTEKIFIVKSFRQKRSFSKKIKLFKI